MRMRPLMAALVLTGACYESEVLSPREDSVATVTVLPATTTVAVDDTVRFRAELRNSYGALLSSRPVSWSLSDTAVVSVWGTFGAEVVVRGKALGSAVVRATSETGLGEAGVTVQ